ncbi:MAG: hypothetical protein ACRYFS_04925 [Janthinobacterium lividum]
MKNTSQLSAIAVLLICFSFGPAHAGLNAQTKLPVGTIRTIQTNAEAAHANAANYQWRRVNLEVDRIVAAEHSLEETLANDPVPAPAEALRRAVLDLRSARLAHDPNRTQAAADQVTTQCALLLR